MQKNIELEELLKKISPDVDVSNIDLEMFQNIVETEPLKIKILKKIKCRKCGWCCKLQSPMLTLEDIKRLCKYLNHKEKELYEKYIDSSLKIPYLKSPCPFLENDRCTIYHVRPKVCKVFPFTDFFLVTDPCPIGQEILDIIMKNGVMYVNKKEDFQKLYDDRIKLLDSITGMDQSKGTEYQSMFIDKDLLIMIIQILKENYD